MVHAQVLKDLKHWNNITISLWL